MHAYLAHPDWPPLLAAIRATPDDDLPRLVAADWLDEHGCHDRAMMIRVGCELASLYRQNQSTASRFLQLQQQVKHLTRLLFPTFLERPNTTRPHDSLHKVFFDRGFVVQVHCPFGWWASRADDLTAQGVELKARITSAVEWQDHPEGSPAYQLVGRPEAFGERQIMEESERHPSTGATLCALTWPAVKGWEVLTSRRAARPLVMPPVPAALGT